MRIRRGKILFDNNYILCNHQLQQNSTNPYLGLTLSDDLKWNTHINGICAKANSTLGFLRRNLRSCPTKLKELSYQSLIRSKLEYSASVWDPHLAKDINALEAVQKRAARFVSGVYDPRSSISETLANLGWISLEQRRIISRLVMMYKVTYGLIAINKEVYLTLSNSRTRSTTKNSLLYRQISCNTEAYRNSFFPRTVKDWNSLSDSIVKSDSVDIFKKYIFELYK